MNYRHAYHAGNHTEVFKHSVLVLLIGHLREKPTAFTVIDSHAGTGLYDLTGPEAQRTGEAAGGIGRVINADLSVAKPYLDIVRRMNPSGLKVYPGSPGIVQAMLREQDWLIACELHPEDASRLRSNFRGDRRVAIHQRDAYEAINALIPPPTRRGLVFIDPPYERPDEFERLADGLNSALRKWPTGMFAAWYPIKDGWRAGGLHSAYRSSNPPTLCVEFQVAERDGVTLAGSGLIVCNPPWKLELELEALCRELALALEAPEAGHRVEWWVPRG